MHSNCRFCPPVVENVDHSLHADGLFIDIDSKKTRFRGLRWRDLGDFGKRKLENTLVIAHNPHKVIFRYH